MQKLEESPTSANTIKHTAQLFEDALEDFSRSRFGKYPLIVVLGWLHRRGCNVLRTLPPATMDCLAKQLRREPWHYSALRTVVPLDEWCGFVPAEQRALETKARDCHTKALTRDLILKDFYKQEDVRERDFEEWKERQEARKNGYFVLSKREEAKLDEEIRNQRAACPDPDFIKRCIPTPLRGLNHALGGGLDRPSVTLISAITRGAKTLFSLQLAHGIARLGSNVLFLSADFGADWIFLRLCANVLRLDFSALGKMEDETQEGRPLTILARRFPEKLEQIKELEHLLENRLVARNWQLAATAPDLGISAHLNSVVPGFKPDLVIVDGLSTAADAAIEERRRQRNNSAVPYRDVRKCYEDPLAFVCELSQAANCAVLVTLQANKARARRTRSVTPQMVQNVPDLYGRFCGKVGFIGISALRDPDKSTVERRQFLNVTQSSNGPGGLVQVEAEFQFQRFVDVKLL